MRRVTEAAVSTGAGSGLSLAPRAPALGAERLLLGVACAAGALLAAAYAGSFWALDALPFQDVPNHLARAVILADLLFHGAHRFGAAFVLKLQAAPYLAGDLALAWLVDRLGPYAAGRLWLILTWACLPASVAAYLRSRRYAPSSIAVATVASFYLATDWSFMTGFQAYRLGVAITLLGLAAWQRVLETGSRRSWAAYVACVGVGYLTHLSAVMMLGVAAAATGLLAVRDGKASVRRVALGAVPLVAAMAWEWLSTHGGAAPGVASWDGPLAKLKRSVSMFHRYEYRYEALLCALYVAMHRALARGWREAWRRSARAATALALAGAFLALYFAMPKGHGYVYWIDCRALPFVPIFVLFAALALAEELGRDWRPAAALALLLAAGNLGLLRAHLLPHNQHMREYREIAARVPSGAFVLPVPTLRQDNATNPYLHAGSFATIEAGAITPYLFVGGVTRYLDRRGWVRVVPSEFWYQQGAVGPFLGLQMIIAGWIYPYLLWEKPYDPSGGPFFATEPVAENRAAALFRVVLGPPSSEAPPAESPGAAARGSTVLRSLRDAAAAPERQMNRLLQP